MRKILILNLFLLISNFSDALAKNASGGKLYRFNSVVRQQQDYYADKIVNSSPTACVQERIKNLEAQLSSPALSNRIKVILALEETYKRESKNPDKEKAYFQVNYKDVIIPDPDKFRPPSYSYQSYYCKGSPEDVEQCMYDHKKAAGLIPIYARGYLEFKTPSFSLNFDMGGVPINRTKYCTINEEFVNNMLERVEYDLRRKTDELAVVKLKESLKGLDFATFKSKEFLNKDAAILEARPYLKQIAPEYPLEAVTKMTFTH